jgi:hypothetical protein
MFQPACCTVKMHVQLLAGAVCNLDLLPMWCIKDMTVSCVFIMFILCLQRI